MTRTGQGETGDWRLDRSSPMPLYLQIRQRVLPAILSWAEPDRRFFSDEELADRFGVSKMTVRQALADLVEDGYLNRTRGRGTFVRKSVFEERLSPRMDVARQYESAGHPQSVRVDEFGPGSASTEVAAALDLRPRAPVLYLRRVRSISRVPIAVDERWIPENIAAAAGFTRRNAAGSVIDRLKQAVPLERADWQIEVRPASARIAMLLLIPRGTPLLTRRMTYVDTAGRPVLTGSTAHRGDVARYTLSMPLAAEEQADKV